MKNILIKPLITEKMTAESERINAYGFVVNDDANKSEIKDAVEKTYSVTVAAVRTMRVDGNADVGLPDFRDEGTVHHCIDEGPNER